MSRSMDIRYSNYDFIAPLSESSDTGSYDIESADMRVDDAE